MSYRIYAEDAAWFALLTTPADYVEEAELYRQIFLEASRREVRDVLELGAGAGNNAAHLKQHFEMTLVDLSPEMIALSKKLNPQCLHAEGDMRTVRLERRFDVVFVHDAITYMTTPEDLLAAARTAFAHCRPGGVAVFVPKFLRDTFRPTTRHGGHDVSPLDEGAGAGRALRWLHWCSDPDPADTMYSVLLTYVLREDDGSFRVETEEHVNGLFPEQTWGEVLEGAGFSAPQFRRSDTSVLVIAPCPEVPA